MKVFLDTIGCRLNQSEIEKMAAQFRAAGHELVEQPALADWVVVNTCAVTAEAASDSRQKIRQAVRAGAKEIIVTGCWATLEPESAMNLDGVTRVVANPGKSHLVSNFLQLPEEEFDREPLARQPLPGIHLRTRAFIKAQDGCDNHCTYCITRIARGPGKSRPVQEIVQDIRMARLGDTQEVVLTGVHLGSWGHDFDRPQHLAELIRAVLDDTDVPRLRLSSLEPWDLDERFFRLWENPRMCRHLHLPLQSGSDSVLKRMVRKISRADFTRLVSMAREIQTQMAITTDLIAGFPGETEAEFQEGCAFARQIAFAGGHVFAYSPRPGTAAARLPNPVPGEIKKRRSAELRAILAETSKAYARPFVGQALDVLWEATDESGQNGWRLHGLSDNYLKVSAFSREKIWNRITPVHLVAYESGGFLGEIIE